MTPSIKLTYFDGSGGFDETGTVTSVDTALGDFFVHIVGTFAGDITYFSTGKFITQVGDSHAWFGSASEPNAPVAGSVGDIQSADISYPTHPSITSYVFPFSSVVASLQDTKMSYVFPANGINVLMRYPKLPTTIGSEIWSWDGQQFTAFSLKSAALLVMLSSPAGFQVSRTISTVCPSVRFINGSGCYDCISPAVLTFEGSSTCLSGQVSVVKEEGSWTPVTASVFLDVVTKIFYISIDATKKYQDGKIQFVGTGGSISVDFEFEAFSDINIQNDTITNDTSVPAHTSSSHHSWDFFGKWFPSLPHWLSILLDVIFGIIVALIGAAILVGMIYLGWLMVVKCLRKPKSD